MIVVDTGGVIALLNKADRHHPAVRMAYDAGGAQWVLPWAILPEVDYLAARYLGDALARAFAEDVAAGVFRVEGWHSEDIKAANRLRSRYRDLAIGLVDSIVMAQAVRLRASAIVTLDARHFRAVNLGLKPAPRLIPLDGA